MRKQLIAFRLAFAVLAAWFGLIPLRMVSAEEATGVAGEWKVTMPDGSAGDYKIDRHGRVEGSVGGKKVAGHAVRQNDYSTLLTFTGSDVLERIGMDDNDHISLGHWDHRADFPAKNVNWTAQGVRQQAAAPYWATEPGFKISDLAGQWYVGYDNSAIHLYDIDKNGNLHGRQNDGVQLSGRIEEHDGRLLLRFKEVDKIERITPRVDGRLVFEHWSPSAGFPDRKFDTVGVGTPVRGKSAPGVEELDRPMVDTLEKIGCSAAALTVTRGGHIYYSRGYGWSDFEHNVPMSPDTPMGIASCSKPLAAAMVRQLCRDKHFPLTFTVLPFLKVKPAGQVVDPRVWDITVQHLIDHAAGWQVDPVNKAWQAYNGSKSPISVEEMLPYVAVQRLAFTPGTKNVYDNFGYQVLDRIVVHLSGQSWVDYLRHSLCRPYGVPELKWVQGDGQSEKGEPPRLWNSFEMNEQKEYRYAVSMPVLCTFMSHFWIDGSVRDKSNPLWVKTGGWDNCTSAMVWRQDGINVAWAFNGRKWTGVGEDNFDAGEALWKNAIDQQIQNHNIR